MPKYLEVLFPDVAACLFPVTKNAYEVRVFRWPGLSAVAWSLLLETMCTLFASLLFTFWTLFWGLRLILGLVRATAIPGLPPASGPKRGEMFPVTKLDASKGQVTPAIIQGFMSRSEPVIIKNLPEDMFSALAPDEVNIPSLRKPGKGEKETAVFANHFYPRLGAFGEWIQKHVQKPVLYLLRLSGNYKATYAHMDGLAYNIYYVVRGGKRVWICPRQYNHLFQIHSTDSIALVLGSYGVGPESKEWIKLVPGVWHFELEQGDVLLFNNSACVHKFENTTENPEVASVRVSSNDVSPVMARHHMCNWKYARYSTTVLFSGNKVMEKRKE